MTDCITNLKFGLESKLRGEGGLSQMLKFTVVGRGEDQDKNDMLI